MRTSLKIAALIAGAGACGLVACAKPAEEASAAAAPAASSAPVKWDETSNDPAKNLVAANKEASTPGFNP